MERITVGPFHVNDATVVQVLEHIGQCAGARTSVYALHVGGLNHRQDSEFVNEMNRADIVYADGMAVVGLAKTAGAKRIERAATTDIGEAALQELAHVLGRRVRVGILGGSPGVAERAGDRLQRLDDVDVVYANHGFHADYTNIISALAALDLDCLVIGMGMPREALWVRDHWSDLPPVPILTCGGWLGFLAGEERRAPKWMQRTGVEWVFRLVQSPGRLLGRYSQGLWTVIALLPAQIRLRRSRP